MAVIPPKYAVSAVVGKIKANTSREIRQRFPEIKKVYWRNECWSVGFFSSTVGIDDRYQRCQNAQGQLCYTMSQEFKFNGSVLNTDVEALAEGWGREAHAPRLLRRPHAGGYGPGPPGHGGHGEGDSRRTASRSCSDREAARTRPDSSLGPISHRWFFS